MTKQQRNLIIYWSVGLTLFLVFILFLYFFGSSINRWLVLTVSLAFAYCGKHLEQHVKPVRPAEVPDIQKFIEENRAWKLFLTTFLLVAVFAALVSVALCSCTSLLIQIRWLLISFVLVPLVLAIIHSERIFYRALANANP